MAASWLAPVQPAQAQTHGAAPASEARSLKDWLMRLHDAANNRAYIGTFVVSAGSSMSSARIWHVCRGDQQVERVESLTGPARSVFRRNDQVLTFLPDSRVLRVEKRASLGLFPEMLQSADANLVDFYSVRSLGAERVAGIQAELVHLQPKDRLRFGYKVWAEQKTGLVVKLQTLDPDGQVVEQAAFSELQLDAPVSMDKLIRMMGKTEGYRLDKPAVVKTTAQAEGWSLGQPVPGFKPVGCQRRVPAASETAAPAVPGPLHCAFSDGLSTVSVFIRAPDASARQPEGDSWSLGATQTLRTQTDQQTAIWMGEVPLQTLRLFAATLERKK